MNAGIAGVARMIERLDLASKRATASPPMPSFTGGTSGFPMKGKTVQENGSGQSPHCPVHESGVGQPLIKESGAAIHDVHTDAPSQVSSTPLEVPHPCIQVTRLSNSLVLILKIRLLLGSWLNLSLSIFNIQSGHDALKT